MEDLNGKDILLGLSGGINSAAVLCWLVENGIEPRSLHIFYAHFAEHSPDTFQFVADGIRYARTKFPAVREKMIPHPKVSPCSLNLKIKPAEAYGFVNELKVDLVGYVKHELKRRGHRQKKAVTVDMFGMEKRYIIGEFTDEWCMEICKRHIGWYPAIYDIVDENGRRVFAHNNCLPCKNMTPEEIEAVKKYFPAHYLKAMQLSAELGKYWGRDEAEFYTRFGRDLEQEKTCENCKW